MDIELIDMADMYASTCTRQKEKFSTWVRWGCPWRWGDCEAAYDLLIEEVHRGTYPSAIWLAKQTTRHTICAGHMDLFPALVDRYRWTPSEEWFTDREARRRIKNYAHFAALLERTGM